MATTIFRSHVARQLQEGVLDDIIDDDSDGVFQSQFLHKWCEEEDMDGAYVDVLEMAGPGLASEKPEGAEMATGGIKEGTLTRAIARTFALRMSITEEAMEDCKYKESINLKKRNKRAMAKTQDIDATNMLVRGWNTAYVGGDGLPLFSASHTLPHGGTFSNTMATPLSPSRSAVIVARTAVRKYPGHDGVTEGETLKMIICPVDQESLWEGIVGSAKVPESDFNEINVVHKMGLEIVAIPYWSNTTTNYAFKTSAEGGPTFYHRRKPRSRTWLENSMEVMNSSTSARWARIWQDARATFGVQA
jgi:hypothetical protein